MILAMLLRSASLAWPDEFLSGELFDKKLDKRKHNHYYVHHSRDYHYFHTI